MDRDRHRRSARDVPVLALFVGVWCEDHHQERERETWVPPRVVEDFLEGPLPDLCEPCRRVLGYAVGQRILCPLDPKPECKKCETPCFREEHRQTMRAIMRYSGWRLLLRGHVGLLRKYFF